MSTINVSNLKNPNSTSNNIVLAADGSTVIATLSSTTLTGTDLNATNLKNPSSGSNNIVLDVDGSTAITTLTSTDIIGTTIQGTIKQSTVSGPHPLSPPVNNIDFTSIPSWAKKITVMFDGVSSSSNSTLPNIQLGTSGGIETTGYDSVCVSVSAVSNNVTRNEISTTGIILLTDQLGSADASITGNININKISGNTWIATGNFTSANASGRGVYTTTSTKTLSSTLDRIRIKGSPLFTFDAGSVSILFEG